MRETKLNDDQRAILTYMNRWPGEPQYTQWIAEGCGHSYDTPWASGRLPGLAKRGLVEKTIPGCWRITDAGREALSLGKTS